MLLIYGVILEYTGKTEENFLTYSDYLWDFLSVLFNTASPAAPQIPLCQ